jgi:hypothetical protein
VEGRAIESDSVPTCVRGMCGRPVPGLLARSSFFFLTFLFFLIAFFPFFFWTFLSHRSAGGRNRAGGATARVTRTRSGKKGAACVVGLRRAWGKKEGEQQDGRAAH